MAAGGEVGMIKAVVVGGTGAIGRHLVGYLLKHKDKVEKVTVLGRRTVEVCKENKIDFYYIVQYESEPLSYPCTTISFLYIADCISVLCSR